MDKTRKTKGPPPTGKILVERVQTGVRLEKRLLKVLKGLAEYHDMTLGDLLEGIVLHAFDGRHPFGEETRQRIADLKRIYKLDLDADASHQLLEAGDSETKSAAKAGDPEGKKLSQNKHVALVVLRLVLGLVVLIQSFLFLYGGESAAFLARHGLPDAVRLILGWSEVVAAVFMVLAFRDSGRLRFDEQGRHGESSNVR